ncbi:recombinase family protein [Roseovarius sp. M141]|uniref:recombinase family protein n=1 Tax=Roseovarius sp. M141 TaxID=2583806 RepID=UPI0020CE083B|nr:recombinase family protein [Roseovarius sp. M141]
MGVQDRLGLVFELFLKLRSIAKVMRMLNARGLDLPRRDRHGELHWARATVSAVAAILKNPAYAGAFVYGRTRMRDTTPDGRSPAKAKSGETSRGMAYCREGPVSGLYRLADL